MSNDESRGRKRPDRPENRTRADDHPPKPTNRTTYDGCLDAIDRLTAAVLTDVRVDDDLKKSDLERHLREIRAEVECARQKLPGDGITTDVPMVRRGGRGVTSWLGPDPSAFERFVGDDRTDNGP
ncbi:hypothetical protein EA462_06115 [Natrarchaeobius halalkaliphilus]|uniref:Uncharacterized protein n=1 Tax=Natrarchaeobius halalkaliphilus TaxID=1679091 RepID=A0A3N6N0T6_9EURY|nr:hypothetical protein [Natrarchaeobius halalkaliphilus]RQG91532.1 hypothetical protein EA462_06115 [Natrarchaeobius halalkaliphilus]